jgi:hypothetical protein
MEVIDERLHCFLISSTSRFVGVFDTPEIQVHHAWQFDRVKGSIGIEPGPYSRNFYTVSFLIDDSPKKTIVIPQYDYIARDITSLLSVLFGKRFDFHGEIATRGRFHVPDLSAIQPTRYFDGASNNHRPRSDIAIPLNLSEFSRVEPVMIVSGLDDRFRAILLAAAGFYARALRTLDANPESAYLDLVTSGELVSNFFAYPPDELLATETKEMLSRIEAEIEGGDKIVRSIRGSLRQIKRAFTLTLTRLLTERFFETETGLSPHDRLQRADVHQRIRAAYDLRSQYLHTGAHFGTWITPRGTPDGEVQFADPVIEDKALKRAIKFAPTFTGLERMTRYALLRFAQLNGVTVDAGLDGVGLVDPVSAADHIAQCSDQSEAPLEARPVAVDAPASNASLP